MPLVSGGCAGGFPAHAGMDPERTGSRSAVAGLPRTRGDGPVGSSCPRWNRRASPHTRGWTRIRHRGRRAGAGFPAHAGMDHVEDGQALAGERLPRTRGDGPYAVTSMVEKSMASPHTRGWTGHSQDRHLSVHGFPAHAGMDPCSPSSRPRCTRLPRTRGDGPSASHPMIGYHVASPHTRGWTPDRRRDRGRDAGFPAHAGMDPQMGL